jgi:hypothetical protein
LALAAFLIYGLARPAPARAGSDITTPIIISSAVAGGVALILIIAIVFADRNDDPDFLDAFAPMKPGPATPGSERAIRFGPQCNNATTGPALLCW